MELLIAQIRLPRAVFAQESLRLAPVTLICGGIGTGKTVLTHVFAHPDALTYRSGLRAADCTVRIYDRRYSAQISRQLGALSGIVPAQYGMGLAETSHQLEAAKREIAGMEAELEHLRLEEADRSVRFAVRCEQKTASMRARFPAAFRQVKQAHQFAEALLHSMPRFREFGELAAMYEAAFPVQYPMLPDIPDPAVLDHLSDVSAAAYREAANALFIPIQEGLRQRCPQADYTPLLRAMTALRQVIRENLARMQEDGTSPAPTAALAEDLRRELLAVNETVRSRQISGGRTAQHDCTAAMISAAAYQLRHDIGRRQAEISGSALRRQMLEEQRNEAESRRDALAAKQKRMQGGQQDLALTAAQINRFLRDADVTGIALRAQADGTYMTVRADGTPAEQISWGEQRLLSFLYFDAVLRTVTGDCLAVLDDPFSGMDDTAASVIRRCITDAYARGNRILLTLHDPQIMREIAALLPEAVCMRLDRSPDGTVIRADT
ncbi:MAG TPA: hypothetical protein DDX71_05540 [Ruminococcus sp.]|nr:hypothetical protein [Ruminococcus sp.]